MTKNNNNFSNLSNLKDKAWKNQCLNRIQARDLRDTGAMLYQLSCMHAPIGSEVNLLSLYPP